MYHVPRAEPPRALKVSFLCFLCDESTVRYSVCFRSPSRAFLSDCWWDSRESKAECCPRWPAYVQQKRLPFDRNNLLRSLPRPLLLSNMPSFGLVCCPCCRLQASAVSGDPQSIPSKPLTMNLVETLDLFFRRACYYQNVSYRKKNGREVVDKL